MVVSGQLHGLTTLTPEKEALLPNGGVIHPTTGIDAARDKISSTFQFLATHPEVPGSIPGATRFSEK
ncbi:hypothetical protein B7P43_G17035 [Cryptotermes secundus]|uniref:Uncharacterized protein n=1 Tax=Cryptotermes secundus TaxID=105785 RepID=A0A2J7PGM0_9NEOP|nr:hypothetical protein B7P43_G17035 [Cryptotermes secundus]